MSKILITGGAGFIGLHLAKKLALNPKNNITLTDNFQRGKDDDDFNSLIQLKNVRFFQADLSQPNDFNKFDIDFEYIYHLAAIIGVSNVMNHPDKVLAVNSLSIINLLEWLKLKGSTCLKKLLFSSTSEIYAGTLKHYGIPLPTHEDINLTIDDIKGPRSTYALTKMLGESACFNYGKLYDIPFSIVRYHNVYGPRMGFAHVIPETFVKINQTDYSIEVPSAEHTRAFCFIDDAVDMTISITESEACTNEIFHLGNAHEESSISTLVEQVAVVMEKSIKVKPLPATEGSPTRRCPDTSKYENYFGKYDHTSLQEGLKLSFNWYKSRISEVVSE